MSKPRFKMVNVVNAKFAHSNAIGFSWHEFIDSGEFDLFVSISESDGYRFVSLIESESKALFERIDNDKNGS